MKSIGLMAATFDSTSNGGLGKLHRDVMDLKWWTGMRGRECLNMGQGAMGFLFLNTTAPSALTLCLWRQFKIL